MSRPEVVALVRELESGLIDDAAFEARAEAIGATDDELEEAAVGSHSYREAGDSDE